MDKRDTFANGTCGLARVSCIGMPMDDGSEFDHHGGQGVKALALAFSVIGNDEYLATARLAADFILRNQIRDPTHPELLEGGQG